MSIFIETQSLSVSLTFSPHIKKHWFPLDVFLLIICWQHFRASVSHTDCVSTIHTGSRIHGVFAGNKGRLMGKSWILISGLLTDLSQGTGAAAAAFPICCWNASKRDGNKLFCGHRCRTLTVKAVWTRCSARVQKLSPPRMLCLVILSHCGLFSDRFQFFFFKDDWTLAVKRSAPGKLPVLLHRSHLMNETWNLFQSQEALTSCSFAHIAGFRAETPGTPGRIWTQTAAVTAAPPASSNPRLFESNAWLCSHAELLYVDGKPSELFFCTERAVLENFRFVELKLLIM